MPRGFFAFLVAFVLALTLLALVSGTRADRARFYGVREQMLLAEHRAFARAQIEWGTDAVVENTVRQTQPVAPFYEERLEPALGVALFAHYARTAPDHNAHFSLCTPGGQSVFPLLSPAQISKRMRVSLPESPVPHRCPVQVTFAPALPDAAESAARDALVVCAHEGGPGGALLFVLPRDYTFREEFACP